jgi:hypothetical protein
MTEPAVVLPNAAGGRNQGFEIRMNRPRAFSSQHKTVSLVMRLISNDL